MSARQSIIATVIVISAACIAWGVSREKPQSRFASDAEVVTALMGKSEGEVKALLGEPDIIGAGPPQRPEIQVWRYPNRYQGDHLHLYIKAGVVVEIHVRPKGAGPLRTVNRQ